MNDAEETIARLLTGLRDAEPPLGMRRRILETMEARKTVASNAPREWRAATAMCLARVVVLTALWIVTVTVRRRSPAPPNHATSADMLQNNSPHIAATTPLRVGAERRPRRHEVRGDTRIASYPAPPLPLTEQEMLLLRLAHRRDAGTTAILNPDLRAAQTAKATEQFQQFFGIDAKEMKSQIE
jgi:hypothetical protein